MSALDFMFQGQTPAQGTNYSQNQSNVPAWLQQYTQGILAQAGAVASQPYQAYGGPRIAGLTPQQTQAQQSVQDIQGQYKQPLGQAQQLAASSSNPSAITGALGYLPQAQQQIQSALSPTAAMMNPYAQNVINKAETDAKQFWQNTLQPSIQQQYAAAGQSGSSADLRAQEEQANQLTENLQATSNSALSQAYQQAQNAGLQGASALGNLAQIGGGLGYEQGVLGLQGAGTLGSLASQGQQLGLQGAGALDTIGGEQQQQNQQNLNLGYQDFLNQQQYPYQQESWLSQMLSGTANPTTVPGMTQGAQTSYAPSVGASPLSQAIGLYSGLNSGQVGSALAGGAARGGSIRRRRKVQYSGLEQLRKAA
jgi:hypothetical protein